MKCDNCQFCKKQDNGNLFYCTVQYSTALNIIEKNCMSYKEKVMKEKLKYNITNCGHKKLINHRISVCELDYNDCKDCNLNRPKVKFKKVVKEIPKQDIIVSYKWLRKQNACQDGIDAFVNEFGKEAGYDAVFNKLTYRIMFNHDYIFSVNWLDWLKSRKHLLENKDNCEYITIDKIDEYNKLYIVQNKKSNLIYKIVYSCYSPRYQFIDLNINEKINFYNLIDALNEFNMYEFNSFNDFIDWYKEESNE
jgi:hypothetical protein